MGSGNNGSGNGHGGTNGGNNNNNNNNGNNGGGNSGNGGNTTQVTSGNERGTDVDYDDGHHRMVPIYTASMMRTAAGGTGGGGGGYVIDYGAGTAHDNSTFGHYTTVATRAAVTYMATNPTAVIHYQPDGGRKFKSKGKQQQETVAICDDNDDDDDDNNGDSEKLGYNNIFASLLRTTTL
ncbi:N66 matrix protein-like [Sabethes cyaneus]|uniref:N66 matrix protein-like n=1 Tax=Sabethes cyaneus TaxID=53552 RepID=UPI00237D7B6E|nr:N66 matrix protein-like [Sabethes cyaneus]